MPLLGDAVVAIWNGIRPEARQDFYAWHSREHMLERVTIPGFRRGRRLIAEIGQPEWFTLYEVDRPETLSGEAYLARLNAPTEWTRQVVPSFTDVTRSLCRVVLSRGLGVGGYMATLRCNPAEGREGEVEDVLTSRIEDILRWPGIHGAHLCRLERAASAIQTAEKKSRASPTLMAETILMVEGSLREPLADLVGDLILERIAGTSRAEPYEAGLYRLEFLC
jgi:hypothetical protein